MYRLIGCLAASASCWIAAHAQTSGPRLTCAAIRFVQGGAPGTVTDIALRQIAVPLAPLLGVPVVVDNRSSAGGIRALEILKHSPPDGCTLSLVTFSQMSVAPSLFKSLPYDPLEDFDAVGILWRGPQVLVVNAAVPARTLAFLLDLARLHPGSIRYGSPGNGSPTHVFMEALKLASAVDLPHIPYRGAAAHIAVLSGEVEATLDGLAPLLPNIRSGRLRAIAVTGMRRLAALPGVPTFEELHVPGMTSVWVGVVAPKATPAAIIDQLHGALSMAMQAPDVRAAFASAGRLIEPGSPQQMRAEVAAEMPRWREIVGRAHIGP